jgi:hypothetical protein
MISSAVSGSQQVVEGAVFALAQQRGAGEDDGEDGDVVDDLNHRQKPATLQIGVEQRAGSQQHRRLAAASP